MVYLEYIGPAVLQYSTLTLANLSVKAVLGVSHAVRRGRHEQFETVMYGHQAFPFNGSQFL